MAFFYEIYAGLHRLMEHDATCFDEQLILSLLLYTENTIAVGLDGVYEYRYRCVGNVVFKWCDSLDMDAEATSKVDNLVSQAVADAPCSALRQWMTESVLSGDFMRLGGMLAWFPCEDQVMWRIFPDLRFREMMFRRLTGDWQTARQMLWADLAFNWRDKRGDTLVDTIAKQFRYETAFVEGKEKDLLNEAAGILDSIRTERLDTYTVMERKGGQTLTLRHRNGRIFHNVIFPMPVPGNVQGPSLAAQLVTYNGKTYINGSAMWLNKEAISDMERRNQLERHPAERTGRCKAHLFHHCIRQADKLIRRSVHRTGRPGGSLLCRHGHPFRRAEHLRLPGTVEAVRFGWWNGKVTVRIANRQVKIVTESG